MNKEPILKEIIDLLHDKFKTQNELPSFYVPQYLGNKPTSDGDSNSVDMLAYEVKRKNCRSFIILGNGGVGKSAFALKIAEYFFWDYYRKYPNINDSYIPIYIDLKDIPESQSLDKLLEYHLIQCGVVLEKHSIFLDSCLQHRVRRSIKLLIIIDSYDAVGCEKNLYTLNKWNRYDITMITCCRSIALVQENIRALFEVLSTDNRLQIGCMYYQLLPFNRIQIESYISNYVEKLTDDEKDEIRQVKGDIEGIEAWIYNLIKRFPGVEELVKYPLHMKYALLILIRLAKKLQANDSTSYSVARDIFFKKYIEYYCYQCAVSVTSRTPFNGKLTVEAFEYYLTVYNYNVAQDSPQEISELLSPDLIEYPKYCQHELLTAYNSQSRGKYDGDKQQYDANMQALMQAIHYNSFLTPFTGIGGTYQYKMLHPLLTEYLTTSAVVSHLFTEFEFFINEIDTEGGYAWENRIAEKSCVNENFKLLKALANEAKTKQEYLDLLLDIIDASKTIPEVSMLAANAITILNYAGFDFSGRDLSDINIPSADLRYGKFYNTNFTRANLTDVNFCGAYIVGAKFCGAHLNNTKFYGFYNLDLRNNNMFNNYQCRFLFSFIEVKNDNTDGICSLAL